MGTNKVVINYQLKNPFLLRTKNARLESQKEDKLATNRVYEVMYIGTPETAE